MVAAAGEPQVDPRRSAVLARRFRGPSATRAIGSQLRLHFGRRPRDLPHKLLLANKKGPNAVLTRTFAGQRRARTAQLSADESGRSELFLRPGPRRSMAMPEPTPERTPAKPARSIYARLEAERRTRAVAHEAEQR